jgi:hypothetical protein
MVINVGAAKAGDWNAVEKDIKAVVNAAARTLVKVIIETCYLTDEEKISACKAAANAGAIRQNVHRFRYRRRQSPRRRADESIHTAAHEGQGLRRNA